MKRKKNLIIGMSLLATSMFSQSHQWAIKGTNSASSNDAGMAIAIDANGNSFVTGYFYNTITFGSQSVTSSGNKDIFLAKYDSNGNCLWIKKAGGTLDDQGQSVSVDASGNCYITGFYYGNTTFDNISLTGIGSKDVFIAKYDPAGNIQWVNKAGSTSEDEGLGIAASPLGETYVTGYFKGSSNFSSTILTSNGQEDIFIAKYSTTGNLVSVVKASGTMTDRANGIALNGNDLYITGYYNSINCQFGNIISANTNNVGGSSEALIAKYNASNLSPIWIKKSVGGGNESANSITVDANNVYVTGLYSHGNPSFGTTILSQFGNTSYSDIFVSKLNTNGTFIWTVRGGGTGVDDSKSISLTNSGNIYVTGMYGHYNGTGSFGSCNLSVHQNANTFIWKLDQNGACMWASQSNNNIGISNGRAIAAKNCDIYFSGYFSGTNTFGNSSSISTSGVADYNMYFGKISESSVPLTINLTCNNTFCSGANISATGSVLSGVSNNYWWELIESDSQGNFTPNGFTWNNNWAPGAPGAYTFPANINPPCNKYYVLKLAVGNFCQPWIEKTKVIYIACKPNGLTSVSNICLGSSSTLCIDEVYEQPSTTYTLSWGKKGNNINCINVTPAIPGQTNYAATITNTITGCVGQKSFVVNTYNNNPKFSTTTAHTNGTNYFTVSTTVVDQTANTQPGFAYQWDILNTNTSINTGGYQPCWWHNLSSQEKFPGYNGTNSVDCIALPSEGHFPTFQTYKIVRSTWNTYCSVKKDSAIVTNSGSRIGNFDNESSFTNTDKSVLMVYPNPSNGLVKIHVLNSTEKSYRFEVCDVFGKIIFKKEEENKQNNDFMTELNLNEFNLSNGLYILNVKTDNQILSKRIMIEK